MKKRLLSLLLCVVMLLSAVSVSFGADAANRNNRGFKACIATDIHHAVAKSVPKVNGKYQYYNNLGLTPTLAPALLDEFLRQAAAGNADYVFLTGDLTDVPDAAQAKAVAKKLARFEKQTGKQVFVINGNHDIVYTADAPKSAMTFKTFKQIYARFGYDEALAIDQHSGSYTADLKNGYRLIAIDALDRPGEGGATITPHLAAWIKKQAAAAKKSGAKLVALMHHPLMDHFTMMGKLLPIFVVSNSKEACELFAQCGIQYVFTGHFHQNDIAVYHGARDVYDIETTSLSCYPNAYRTAAFSADGLRVRTVPIKKIDTSALPKGYTAKQKAAIDRDLSAYSYSCLQKDGMRKIESYFNADKVMGMLGTDDPAIRRALELLLNTLSTGFALPLYGSGETVEAYAKQAGFKLPKSDYKTLGDAAAAFIAAQLSGDENFRTDSKLLRVAFIGLLAILQHSASSAAGPFASLRLQRALVRASSLLLAKIGLPSKVSAAAGGSPADEAIRNLAFLLLKPLLTGLTIDKEPADNNIDLPGYAN